MGFKAVELSPLNGVTTTVPTAKPVLVKAFRVLRTDTTAKLEAVLPAGASIISFQISGAASDAGTSATLSIGSTTAANEYVNAQDVKGAGTFIRPAIVGTAIPQVEPIPQTGDVPIYAKYAESGTASTVGAWIVVVYFVM